MNYNVDRQVRKTTQVRRFYTAALVLASTFGAVSNAAAQRITSPPTSTLITPPVGNSAFLVGNASGTQGYVCLPKGAGFSWSVNNARPEATLFTKFFGQDVQIITHFLSPDTNPIPGVTPDPVPFGSATWQSSFDSSKVWAQVLHKNTVPAGSEPACPNDGAIACLLLQSIGTQQGPSGGKLLAKTTFVQRLNTKGGTAPDDADGCSSAANVGNQRLVPYTADYYFFHKDE